MSVTTLNTHIMRIFLFLAIVGLLIGCKDQDPELAKIGELEKQVETAPSAENTKALVDAYRQYIDTHPGEVEENADLLFKSASLQFHMNRLNGAVKALHEALRDYYPASKTPDNALLLATLYGDKLQNPIGASAVYEGFVEAFPDHPRSKGLRDSLLQGQIGLIAQIDSLRSRLYNDQTNRIDYEVANDFIGVCEIYGLLLPADQHTPDYLHEAAKTAGYIRSFPKALELYEWLYEKYPTHEKAAQALFMMGFTYDNEIKDIDKAKELYEAFIEKYPDNDFADDARFLLENLGKSDEEIISSFGNE